MWIRLKNLIYSISLLLLLFISLIFGVTKLGVDSIVKELYLVVFIVLYFYHSIGSIESHPYWDEIKKNLVFYFLVLTLFFAINHVYDQSLYIYLMNIIHISLLFIATLTINYHIRRTKLFRKKVLIIGTGKTAKAITDKIKDNYFTLYDIVGYTSIKNSSFNKKSFEDDIVDKERIVCEVNDIEEYLNVNQINIVIIAVPEADNEDIFMLNKFLAGKVENIKYIPAVNGVYTFNSKSYDYDGILTISSSNNKYKIIDELLKRILDILFSIVGIAMLLPLTILVYFMNRKYGDKGPVFFAQDRIGTNGKIIKIYKYRTMILNADKILEEYLLNNKEANEEYSIYKKLRNDPRVTKMGDILRKTSLDEFPQFINVLKGEMSIVGPRPYLEREKEEMYPYYQNIINNKPGITGMWQVSGRSDTDFNTRLELDAYYHYNWSIWLDIVIIIRTIKDLLLKRGAY